MPDPFNAAAQTRSRIQARRSTATPPPLQIARAIAADTTSMAIVCRPTAATSAARWPATVRRRARRVHAPRPALGDGRNVVSAVRSLDASSTTTIRTDARSPPQPRAASNLDPHRGRNDE